MWLKDGATGMFMFGIECTHVTAWFSRDLIHLINLKIGRREMCYMLLPLIKSVFSPLLVVTSFIHLS
jgi:hypothetical protein